MTLKWYITNVVSGQENKVCDEINRIAADREDIGKAFVPVRKVVKIKKGKKVEDTQRLFPGYVFVSMDLDSDSYTDVRSVPKVLGFLGCKKKPESVSEEKINSILKKIENNEFDQQNKTFEIGDVVRVTEGSFESFTGTVEGRDNDKNILKISISIFGRPTIIDIDVTKIEKV